ncbi:MULTISPECIES: hypothetical protein [Okeania]|nr:MULTISPECIES: hypothetical protein [Okeania]
MINTQLDTATFSLFVVTFELKIRVTKACGSSLMRVKQHNRNNR